MTARRRFITGGPETWVAQRQAEKGLTLTVAQKKALRAAVKCIGEVIQGLAANANLCDTYGADFPAAVNASERRKKLIWAAKVIEEMNGKVSEVEK